MPLDQQNQDDFTQRRLQRLELRYRRAQFVLAGAQAVYDSLRSMPVVDELRLRQALQRVEQTRELLLDIQCTIEYLEDQERVAQAYSGGSAGSAVGTLSVAISPERCARNMTYSPLPTISTAPTTVASGARADHTSQSNIAPQRSAV